MSTKWMDGMNGPAMDRWMADLRSGKFNQTKGVLKNAMGAMCCLGVATDTNVAACELTSRVEMDRTYFEDSEGRDYSSLMPVSVMDHLGIPAAYRETCQADGSILVVADTENAAEWGASEVHDKVGGHVVIDVVVLNDTVGKTFSEIADRIEKTFKVEV